MSRAGRCWGGLVLGILASGLQERLRQPLEQSWVWEEPEGIQLEHRLFLPVHLGTALGTCPGAAPLPASPGLEKRASQTPSNRHQLLRL